jgi:predicted dehydrogenase
LTAGTVRGRGFLDFNELVTSAKPDAVWLCTPPRVRRDPLLLCARAGIPVFCEKPAKRDPATAAAILRELKRLKARVQVGYVFRSMPTVTALIGAMKDDRIHTAQSLSSSTWSRPETGSGIPASSPMA